MANSMSARKRIRVAERRRIRNRARQSTMKTAIKHFRQAATSGDATTAQERFVQAASAIDRAASKGVIHKNQAARRKARLAKKLNELSSASAN